MMLLHVIYDASYVYVLLWLLCYYHYYCYCTTTITITIITILIGTRCVTRLDILCMLVRLQVFHSSLVTSS